MDLLISIIKGTEGGFILLACTPALVSKRSLGEVCQTRYHGLLLGLPRFVSNPPGRPAAERLTALPPVLQDRGLQRCPVTRVKAAAGLRSSCPEGARGGEAGVSWVAAPAPGAFLQLSENTGMCDTPNPSLPQLSQHMYV